MFFFFQFVSWWHTSTLSVPFDTLMSSLTETAKDYWAPQKEKDGAFGLKAAGIMSCRKMFSNTTPVQTFRTHLHVRQDKPAMDFKTNFITTDP